MRIEEVKVERAHVGILSRRQNADCRSGRARVLEQSAILPLDLNENLRDTAIGIACICTREECMRSTHAMRTVTGNALTSTHA